MPVTTPMAGLLRETRNVPPLYLRWVNLGTADTPSGPATTMIVLATSDGGGAYCGD